MGHRLALLAFAGLAVVLTSCGDPPLPYPVRIRATSDGAPLPGTRISLGGDVVGTTGPDGILYVEIGGEEGQTLSLSAACPPGHEDPERLPEVRLRRVSGFSEDGAPRAVEREVPCPPSLRHAVVLVRTDGIADLPIWVDGREVGRTDPHGVAHVAYRGEPRRSFEVKLDTEAYPALRPREPSRSFSVPAERDDLYVWNVELREPVGSRPRPRPRPRMNMGGMMGPERLR
jgi:hypothetical protein